MVLKDEEDEQTRINKIARSVTSTKTSTETQSLFPFSSAFVSFTANDTKLNQITHSGYHTINGFEFTVGHKNDFTGITYKNKFVDNDQLTSFLSLCSDLVIDAFVNPTVLIRVVPGMPDGIACQLLIHELLYNGIATAFSNGGGLKGKQGASKYTRTSRKHRDVRGVIRVVYSKGTGEYVKKKTRSGTFTYKKVSK